jgi:hypothetical protein
MCGRITRNGSVCEIISAGVERDMGEGIRNRIGQRTLRVFFFGFRWFLWPALAGPRLAAGLPDPYKSNTTTSWVTCP